MKQLSVLVFILSIILFIVPISLSAQVMDDAYMSCTYSAFFVNDIKTNKVHDDEMVLEIGKKYSRFYSVWEDSITRIRSEKLAQGMSVEDCRKAIQGIPRSYQFYEIEKFLKEKKLWFSNKLLTEVYRYEELLERPVWQIETVRETVIGYSCQRAKARFRGRDWTVWFTSDIPVSDGPWKLWGLPGLILKAEDSEKQYTFLCIGIKQFNPPKAVRRRTGKEVKCSAAEYKKMEKEFKKDYNSLLFKELGYREPMQPGQKQKQSPFNPIER